MKITKLTLKRPVSVFLLLIMLIVFAVSALTNFKLGYMPAMEFPALAVSTVYVGADADVIDETVSKPIEEIGQKLPGFQGVTATSRENQSLVVFTLDYDTDIDEVYTDLKAQLDTINLPDETGEPTVIKVANSTDAAMTLSLTSKTGADVLAFASSVLMPNLSTIDGVASVNVQGGSEGYISVTLDEQKLSLYGVSADTIAQAIQSANYTIPAGNVSQGDQEISVFSSSKTATLAELQNIPITTPAKGIISLQDVAAVSLETDNVTSISRYNGNANISVQITAEQDADLVRLSDEIYKEIDNSLAVNNEITVDIISDTSENIEASLSAVLVTLITAIFLCMLVLFLFLGDIKASLIVGSSIPISLFMTVIAMYLSGFELNIITTTALVITIGMTVDNAIVVLESIFRNKTNQNSYNDAAILGVKAVDSSVVASTITTIVVYAPLAFLSGMISIFFSDMALTIIFAMIASIIAAFTIVPLFYTLIKPVEKETSVLTKGLNKLEKSYEKVVSKIIDKKKLAVIVAVFLLILSFALATQIEVVARPSTDANAMTISATFKPDTNLETIDNQITQIEKMLLADRDIESYTMTSSGETAEIDAYLSEKANLQDVITEYEQTLKNTIVGFDVVVSESGGALAAEDSSVETITVSSTDYNSVIAAAEDMTEKLYMIDGVEKVQSELSATKSKVNVDIDHMLAAQLNVNPSVALKTVRTATSGVDAGDITLMGTKYDILIEYPSDSFDTASDLATLNIPTTTGTYIPLESVADIHFTNAMQEITRENERYYIDLEASISSEKKETALEQIDTLKEQNNYPGVSFDKLSRDAFDDTIGQLLGAIATSIFLVFMVMAMQFESPRFSFMVMSSVMFSFIGSFVMLFVTDMDISMISLMGILMLIGIVVNNGILFVDTTNHLKATMPIKDALIQTGKMRMRPILMTTMTTILSMIPPSLGIGEGSEVLQSMGIVIIGGLITSTLLVLLLMPAFYLIIGRRKKGNRKFKK